jgi:hypothetical protein
MELVMKIYYMNDEHEPIMVQVNGQLKPSKTNPYGEPTIEHFVLQPQEGRVFVVDAPEGAIPWIKRWETQVILLTYIESDSLPE